MVSFSEVFFLTVIFTRVDFFEHQNPLNRVITVGSSDYFGLHYDKEKYKEMLGFSVLIGHYMANQKTGSGGWNYGKTE